MLVSFSYVTLWFTSFLATVKAGTDELSPGWGIESITPESEDWGSMRIRIEPDKATKDRISETGRSGGFYIHNSHKGYTHGCVEVETSFFDELIEYRKLTKSKGLDFVVKYLGKTTNGGTKTR